MITAAMLDSREPASILSLKFGNVPVLVTALEYGDLWASCEDGDLLVIERKTVLDLLNSIKDNRLFLQCAGLRQKSQWAYLVITGLLEASLDGHLLANSQVTGWRFDDVQAALLSVQELGVGVIFARSDEEYEASVIRLAKRERKKERVLQARVSSRVMTPGEQILASLPGIGIERATVLSEEFAGRVCDAIAWLTWLGGQYEIAGISTGTKSNVRRALGLEPNEEMGVFRPQAKTLPEKAEGIEV